MFWKIFDFGLNILSQADWITPIADEVRGLNNAVYFGNGYDATVVHDYLRSQGILCSQANPLFGDSVVAVRRKDVRLAKSLLSRKR